jgi:hypothetical protein
MAIVSELGIEIKTDGIKYATECLNDLAAAAERAEKAIAKLGDAKHGGLVIDAVGDVMTCKVLPSRKQLFGALRMWV